MDEETTQPAKPQGGGLNVPALIGLIFAIVGLLGSFIPAIGTCIAIPMAVVALSLGVAGFIVAGKRGTSKALPTAATSVAALSVLIAAMWWGWLYLESEKQEEEEQTAQAKEWAMNEGVPLGDLEYRVLSAVSTPAAGAEGGSVITVRVTIKNDSSVSDRAGEDDFRLTVGGEDFYPDSSFSEDVGDGTSTTFEVPFSIGEASGETKLRVRGLNPFTIDKFRWIDLTVEAGPSSE